MTTTLREMSAGNYRYLPGIAPFSSGVVATAGHQIVHATLRAPIPWRDGFALIDRDRKSTRLNSSHSDSSRMPSSA